jgi:hypothetical protein
VFNAICLLKWMFIICASQTSYVLCSTMEARKMRKPDLRNFTILASAIRPMDLNQSSDMSRTGNEHGTGNALRSGQCQSGVWSTLHHMFVVDARFQRTILSLRVVASTGKGWLAQDFLTSQLRTLTQKSKKFPRLASIPSTLCTN